MSCPKAGVSHTPDPPAMPPLRWPPRRLSSPRGDRGAGCLQTQDLPRGHVGCEFAPAQQQEGRGWTLGKPNPQGFGTAGRRRQEDSSAQSCHQLEDSPCSWVASSPALPLPALLYPQVSWDPAPALHHPGASPAAFLLMSSC